jgi:transposase-like protein
MTNWVRQSRDGGLAPGLDKATAVKRPVSELEAENARLHRELASAKLDLEILRKRRRVSRRSRGEIRRIERHRDH